MRVAVIDLGTNTFHLLVAEGIQDDSFKILYRETFVAKIGRGGISQGLLTDEAYQKTLGALVHFRQQIDRFDVPVEKIYATATSAIRNARNGTQLVTEIEKEAGIKVQVISGDQEAEYIYRGVRMAVPMGQQTSMVMDIGGGSVEFIIGNDNRIFWKRSFEIGAQRLLDRFMTTDPISPQAIQRMNGYLEETLIPLTNAVHQYAPAILIGASGTFETLCAIEAKQRGVTLEVESLVSASLSIDTFNSVLQTLVTENRAGRLAIPGMIEMRVDMIVVACCLLDFVLKKYAISDIKVSGYALKEGLLITQVQTN